MPTDRGLPMARATLAERPTRAFNSGLGPPLLHRSPSAPTGRRSREILGISGRLSSCEHQVLLRITPSFSARGAAELGCRAARAEMLSALAACNVRHAHLVRCLFGKTRRRHPCAPNAGMRCGLPASSRQCGRCLGWSSTYADGADTSEPPNASPIPTTEVASTDARRTIFPVPCRHSRTPMIRTWMTSQRRG